tara:strand:+ start:186 stop:626 length:441 start_codon:yes stop_codon:yes gene_type:complete
MTNTETINFAIWSNEELLDWWFNSRIEYNKLYIEMDKIKYVLDQRMKANHARSIPHQLVSAEMGAPTAIVDRLISLREVVGPEEFNRAFTPAHIETKEIDVPDKINMTVVNGWAKQGNHIREIIDHGTDHESATLTLKLKEKYHNA